jgi:hypothetical protein
VSAYRKCVPEHIKPISDIIPRLGVARPFPTMVRQDGVVVWLLSLIGKPMLPSLLCSKEMIEVLIDVSFNNRNS